MEKYEQLSIVGEGSYGLVMKCRHRDTDQIVAIKKFLETEEDATLRRMALREIRMLKRLRHENLVTMIEVFRHRKRFYLVFEYMEGTVLDELEKYPEGLGNERTRERIFQVTRALQYCHSNHIIHRDVKPENVLVSSTGVVKLCDFGFARLVGGTGESYTEYVATRWYRAPELLVGEQYYGAPVDIWAVGCLFSEMMTGEPLFPGESDIDQLFLIVKLIGKPCTRHQQLMSKNSNLKSIRQSSGKDQITLQKLFPDWSLLSVDFLASCTKMDPQFRPTADDLLKHTYFTHDRFPEKFLPALREKVRQEFNENPLLRKFKAEIFIQGDIVRKEDLKLRRTPQVDQAKWRINFVQGSVKRKFSSDTIHSEENKSLISLNNKTSSKLSSHIQKVNQYPKNHSLQAIKRDEYGTVGKDEKLHTNRQDENVSQHGKREEYSVQKQKEENKKIYDSKKDNESTHTLRREDSILQPLKSDKLSPNISDHKFGISVPRLSHDKSCISIYTSKDNPRLEKALDLLSKLNKKNNYCRPKSTKQDYHQHSNIPTSPPEFQSLQSQSFREISKSPPGVLHPSITNLSFVNSRDSVKKLPHTVQNINNLSLKSVFSQVPVTHPPKSNYLKKLDTRYVVIETTPIQPDLTRTSPPDWMSSVGIEKKKRDPWKTKPNDFTLPTVPGATGSPNKCKKKQLTPELLPESIVQTPRIQSSNSSQKTSSSSKMKRTFSIYHVDK